MNQITNSPFKSDYENFIHVSRYARWREEDNRREEWGETVTRYFDFMESHLQKKHKYQMPEGLRQELYDAIYNFELVPSMRSMMTAGTALSRENTAGYNCAYLPIDNVKSFDEAMFILLCGTGVGFSVERQSISKLPEIPENLPDALTTITVGDSKEGWALGLREVISTLYGGQTPKWDTSLVRPAGAKLKTFGGRASGPGPLEDLFRFVVSKFKAAAGRKLNSLEVHDIMCKIGEVVVVGGVRRSAMISLSNLSDDRMRGAKSGSWWENEGQRALANNSVCYTEKPDVGSFLKEWTSLYESKSGERGIFNRQAAEKQVLKNGRRKGGFDWGVNPCAEIILRPQSFCNLTEAVIRQEDTVDTLKRKIHLASILGTFQSTLTHFPYLRPVWKKNAEEERLLGVSLTGIMDNKFMSGQVGGLAETLEELRQVAIDTNKEFADAIGIPQSAAISTIKPSGTVSQLVDSASGIHTRHSDFYIRSVRADNKDPISQFLIDRGVPYEADVTKPQSTTVFYFPIKAPEGSLTRDSLTAIEHLEIWKTYKEHWCEHTASITVTVKEHEWFEVGAWVFKNFDSVSGVSFLPHSDHSYRQAPYQECTEEEYNEMKAKMPEKINWVELSDYEKEDTTVSSSTFACVSGEGCEVVDLT